MQNATTHPDMYHYRNSQWKYFFILLLLLLVFAGTAAAKTDLYDGLIITNETDNSLDVAALKSAAQPFNAMGFEVYVYLSDLSFSGVDPEARWFDRLDFIEEEEWGIRTGKMVEKMTLRVAACPQFQTVTAGKGFAGTPLKDKSQRSRFNPIKGRFRLDIKQKAYTEAFVNVLQETYKFAYPQSPSSPVATSIPTSPSTTVPRTISTLEQHTVEKETVIIPRAPVDRRTMEIIGGILALLGTVYVSIRCLNRRRANRKRCQEIAQRLTLIIGHVPNIVDNDLFRQFWQANAGDKSPNNREFLENLKEVESAVPALIEAYERLSTANRAKPETVREFEQVYIGVFDGTPDDMPQSEIANAFNLFLPPDERINTSIAEIFNDPQQQPVHVEPEGFQRPREHQGLVARLLEMKRFYHTLEQARKESGSKIESLKNAVDAYQVSGDAAEQERVPQLTAGALYDSLRAGFEQVHTLQREEC